MVDKNLQMAETAYALSNKTRIEILKLLKIRGEMSFGMINSFFSFSRSTMYNHVMVLLNHHLISINQKGRIPYYQISGKEQISNLSQFLNDIEEE